YCKIGVALLVTSVGLSCAAVALQTVIYEVMPSPMLSAVDNKPKYSAPPVFRILSAIKPKVG
ncbi:hypothetical protein NPIL_281521, partial [Nephila pilipes]